MLVVALDYSTWLIGFPVIDARFSIGFYSPVPDFKPENRRKVVKTVFSTPNLNVRGQRQHSMAAIGPPWDQNVADDATDSTAGDEDACAFPLNSIQFVEEVLIVADSTQLATTSVGSVCLQVEVRRRRYHEMDRFARYRAQVASVGENHFVPRAVVWWRPPPSAQDSVGF
jgi:hypothetical protein